MKTIKKIYAITLALTCGLAATLKAQNIYVSFNDGTIGEYGLVELITNGKPPY